MHRFPLCLLLLIIAFLAGGADRLSACNVPVFRFALERWRPDPYRGVLLHRGPLTSADQALLEQFGGEESAHRNLVIQPIDLASSDGALPPEVAAHSSGPLPRLVVHYPEHLRIESAAWSGEFTADALKSLDDSPVRRELVKRLIAGETAVWLFLECGDSAKDQPAAELVEQELNKLTQELKLPELTDSPDDVLLSSSPLRIAFSVLRLSRDEAEENALAALLLRCESDLLERSDPLVFPVFGRGRALFPLVGAGINAENIRESASFLVGPCSCQVKELNPGFDLLLAADWDDLLNQEGIVLSAVASEQRRATTGEIELVPIPAGSAPVVEPTAEDSALETSAEPKTQMAPQREPIPPMSWAGAVGLIVIVLVSLVFLLMRR